MTTVFFWKKIILYICTVLGIAVAVISFLSMGVTGKSTVLETQKNFYFLVSTSSHIQASTHNAQYLGGAGYTLAYGDRDYVTYAVYTDVSSGEQAYQSLKQQDKDVLLITLHTKNLRFVTKKDKQSTSTYKSAFECLYAHIRLLNEEIARLDDGATQDSTKRFLKIQRRQFLYMQRQYEKVFSEFSSVCKQAVEQIEEMQSQIVYVKDMRYLSCFLCQSYALLAENVQL